MSTLMSLAQSFNFSLGWTSLLPETINTLLPISGVQHQRRNLLDLFFSSLSDLPWVTSLTLLSSLSMYTSVFKLISRASGKFDKIFSSLTLFHCSLISQSFVWQLCSFLPCLLHSCSHWRSISCGCLAGMGWSGRDHRCCSTNSRHYLLHSISSGDLSGWPQVPDYCRWLKAWWRVSLAREGARQGVWLPSSLLTGVSNTLRMLNRPIWALLISVPCQSSTKRDFPLFFSGILSCFTLHQKMWMLCLLCVQGIFVFYLWEWRWKKKRKNKAIKCT